MQIVNPLRSERADAFRRAGQRGREVLAAKSLESRSALCRLICGNRRKHSFFCLCRKSNKKANKKLDDKKSEISLSAAESTAQCIPWSNTAQRKRIKLYNATNGTFTAPLPQTRAVKAFALKCKTANGTFAASLPQTRAVINAFAVTCKPQTARLPLLCRKRVR